MSGKDKTLHGQKNDDTIRDKNNKNKVCLRVLYL